MVLLLALEPTPRIRANLRLLWLTGLGILLLCRFAGCFALHVTLGRLILGSFFDCPINRLFNGVFGDALAHSLSDSFPDPPDSFLQLLIRVRNLIGGAGNIMTGALSNAA